MKQFSFFSPPVPDKIKFEPSFSEHFNGRRVCYSSSALQERSMGIETKAHQPLIIQFQGWSRPPQEENLSECYAAHGLLSSSPKGLEGIQRALPPVGDATAYSQPTHTQTLRITKSITTSQITKLPARHS